MNSSEKAQYTYILLVKSSQFCLYSLKPQMFLRVSVQHVHALSWDPQFGEGTTIPAKKKGIEWKKIFFYTKIFFKKQTIGGAYTDNLFFLFTHFEGL